MKDDYVLELYNVSKSFPGTKALDGVQFKLKKGSVHALVGENGAGKSTLMKCLLGIYHMDDGDLFIKGKKVIPHDVKQMHHEGLSIIQQELSPVYDRSIMENIWLGREPMKGIFVNHRKMHKDTKLLLEKFKLNLDPKIKMKELSVSQIQMIEIIKAVSWNVDIVMMDEPTSALTNAEVDQLFDIINNLRKDGVSIIYVSHKMDEIYKIAQEVTVLRDGKWIAHHLLSEVTINQIISEMVGRDISGKRMRVQNTSTNDVVLSVEKLYDNEGVFQDVSFDLHCGEILGLAGLVGAGRTEVLESLFGLRKKRSGMISIKGKPLDIKNSRTAIIHGMALLTEDRQKDGIIGVLDILQNIFLASYDKFSNKIGGFFEKNAVNITNGYIDKLRIKTPGWSTKIENLSGGNQQKVLVARWLLSDPDILLMDEPTRGIDVGSKSEIHQLMINLAEEGKSILVVSSEMPELLKICDRIIVMSAGHITGILNSEETDQESIIKLS